MSTPAPSGPARAAPAGTAGATYAERIAFVVEVAERLHAYGTTTQRLEGAIESVSRRLGVECEPWASPTGMILSFSDPARPAGESDTTRVIRSGLGELAFAVLPMMARLKIEVLESDPPSAVK